jgi:hypothetical protein
MASDNILGFIHIDRVSNLLQYQISLDKCYKESCTVHKTVKITAMTSSDMAENIQNNMFCVLTSPVQMIFC